MSFAERRRALLSQGGEFPAEPTAYTELLASVTASTTWTAPEDGWFEIRLHGTSGTGGHGYGRKSSSNNFAYSGGGGGGGGSAVSRIMMKKGDTINFTFAPCRAIIKSSLADYSYMTVSSATNGLDASSTDTSPNGGNGGNASGGNYVNANGRPGGEGIYTRQPYDIAAFSSGGTGGSAGYTGGNPGGNGAWARTDRDNGASTGTPGAGQPGCAQIYRGDTN